MSVQKNKPVSFTRLSAALNKNVIDPGDYVSVASSILDNMSKNPQDEDILVSVPREHAIPFESIIRIANRDTLEISNGFSRLKDGTVYMALTQDFGEITGEMFDWWFCNIEDPSVFRCWHPDAHMLATWDNDFFKVPKTERPSGYYVGHVHIIHTKLGDKSQRINYQYVRPSRFFEIRNFKEQGITACVCAKMFVEYAHIGFVDVGYVVHIMHHNKELKTNELRTHYWLGDLRIDLGDANILSKIVVNYIGNTSIGRKKGISDSFVKNLYKLCREEMACLKGFLNHMYNSRAQKP